MRAAAVIRQGINAMFARGPRRWVGAVLISVFVGYVASLVHGVFMMTEVHHWITTWAPAMGERLPWVQTPTVIGSGDHDVMISGLGGTITGPDGDVHVDSGWSVLRTYARTEATDEMIAWAAFHLAACFLVALLHMVWGHPPLLRGSAGVPMRAVLPRMIVVGACLAIPLPAAAHLLYVMWFWIAFGPPERGGVPMLGLALGLAGIGTLRAGVLLMYLVMLSAVLRRVTRRAWRSRGELACPTCWYTRSPDVTAPCPECASDATPVLLGSSFILASTFAGFRRSRAGRRATRAALATLIVLLLLGPWVLGSMDDLFPRSFLYQIDDVWYTFVRWFESIA